jgi:hypothetical protein
MPEPTLVTVAVRWRKSGMSGTWGKAANGLRPTRLSISEEVVKLKLGSLARAFIGDMALVPSQTQMTYTRLGVEGSGFLQREFILLAGPNSGRTLYLAVRPLKRRGKDQSALLSLWQLLAEAGVRPAFGESNER